MTEVFLTPEHYASLKDQVIVLTGGSTGIGRALIEILMKYNAKVIFGDVQEDVGRKLAQEFPQSLRFAVCDASSYTDQLNLFKMAEDSFGRIDIVVANAAVAVHKDIFAEGFDVEAEPSVKEIDVNLTGVLWTTRIGLHYLRKYGGGDIVLVSSIAGFKESGGLTTYTATKHGVLGILRGLRITATPEKVHINAICPWMTRTRLVKGIEAGWYQQRLPVNEPEDVANAIVLCATANRTKANGTTSSASTPFAGKILYVAGGKSYEIEDRLVALEPEWLGKENSQVLELGQQYLAAQSTSWDADKLRN